MDTRSNEPIPSPVVRRLSLYLRELEALHRKGIPTVSSRQLGETLGLTDAQVRKDFGYFGQFGHAGVGYRVEEMIAELRRILGTDRTWNVLLIGAGNLGRALMAYKGFQAKGFRLVAAFDADAAKERRKYGPLLIQPMSELADTIHKLNVQLAVLAVPADAAQAVADALVAAGIRGILNFAPISVTVPPTVALTGVDLAVQLEQLSFQVTFAQREAGETSATDQHR